MIDERRIMKVNNRALRKKKMVRMVTIPATPAKMLLLSIRQNDGDNGDKTSNSTTAID
jgi:hypothetical protein